MRYLVIFSILIFFFFTGCKKNNYNTIPTLTYKSVNTTALSVGQTIQFTLDFTDAEGDLDSVYVEKYEPQCPASAFTDRRAVPVFPSSKTGKILVSYGYNTPDNSMTAPQCNKNDTCVFKFVLTDKAKHVSDTAVSETIVIIL